MQGFYYMNTTSCITSIIIKRRWKLHTSNITRTKSRVYCIINISFSHCHYHYRFYNWPIFFSLSSYLPSSSSPSSSPSTQEHHAQSLMLQQSAETRNAVFNSRIEFVTLAVIVVPLIINSSLKLCNRRIRNAPPKLVITTQ